jgi:hypothetical protein
MASNNGLLEETFALAVKLSPLDKVRLLERLASTLQTDLAPPAPLKDAYGLVADLGTPPTDEDIQEVRREMWRNFPREDF